MSKLHRQIHFPSNHYLWANLEITEERSSSGMEWRLPVAFDKIKEYLQEPPILMPPVEGRPLITYLTVLENLMGCVLGQHDESGRKEHVLYYLSKKFNDCETIYLLLEKTCCSLAWAAHRLSQYMLTHTTLLISKMDPIKYIFEKPAVIWWENWLEVLRFVRTCVVSKSRHRLFFYPKGKVKKHKIGRASCRERV